MPYGRSNNAPSPPSSDETILPPAFTTHRWDISKNMAQHQEPMGNGEEMDSGDDDDDGGDDDDDVDDESSEGGEGESSEDEGNNEEIKDKKNVEKFILAFSNGDYDAEFDDKLDRGLPSTAHPTQASYTKPDNWRERNRIGLEKVKEQLQSCIDSVSHVKSLELKLGHNGYLDQLMVNEAPIVWHQPILDKYWNQVEEEIEQQEVITDILDIQISNVEMKKERLAALVAMFVSGRANSSST
jgi:hypothetical protein